MTKKRRIINIIKILKEKFPDAKIALDYETDYQLLVAVILSAQCTDKRVNIVTKDFFKVLKSPFDMKKLSLNEVENYVKSTGFYKNKAKNLKLNADILIEKYNGVLPKTLDELKELPGVGRKTANVVLGDLWGITEGIVVDTHVKRITNLIGVVDKENPEIIERELMKIVPKEDWYIFSHLLILHGRDKCIARRPKCMECEIREFCKNRVE